MTTEEKNKIVKKLSVHIRDEKYLTDNGFSKRIRKTNEITKRKIQYLESNYKKMDVSTALQKLRVLFPISDADYIEGIWKDKTEIFTEEDIVNNDLQSENGDEYLKLVTEKIKENGGYIISLDNINFMPNHNDD